MHRCCCSHFGRCNPLRRKHRIWQSCRLLGDSAAEKNHKPGSESSGLASSAQICASAPSGAPPSSGRGRRRWACRSSLFRSSRLLPVSVQDRMEELRTTGLTCWAGQNIPFFYLLSIFMPLEADEPEATRLPTVICHDADAHGISCRMTIRPVNFLPSGLGSTYKLGIELRYRFNISLYQTLLQ